jgi:hypothetical protein
MAAHLYHHLDGPLDKARVPAPRVGIVNDLTTLSWEASMSKLATLVVAVGALALAFVTLSPNSAEAGWRRGPTVVYAGPRYGWFGYRPYYGPHHGYPYAYYPYWRGRYWRGWYYSQAPWK